MDRSRFILAVSACAFVFGLNVSQQVSAQVVTIQQPVVQQFSVNTVVSVPDRGSALLGGVSSARAGRTSFGPLRSGSSIGRSISHSSATVHVWIHDFEAMDRELLRQGPPSSRAPAPLNGMAAHAYSQLMKRHAASVRSQRPKEARRPASYAASGADDSRLTSRTFK